MSVEWALITHGWGLVRWYVAVASISNWSRHTNLTPLSLLEFIHDVLLGFVHYCHIPQQHSSSKDTFFLLVIPILCRNKWLPFSRVHCFICLVKVALVFKRASLYYCLYCSSGVLFYVNYVPSVSDCQSWCFVCVCVHTDLLVHACRFALKLRNSLVVPDLTSHLRILPVF